MTPITATNLIFAPIFTPPLLWLTLGMCLLMAMGILRTLWRTQHAHGTRPHKQAAILRLGALLGLVCVVMAPHTQHRSSTPAADIIFILQDDSPSQAIGDRQARMAAATKHLQNLLHTRPNTEVQIARYTPGADQAQTNLMQALASHLQTLPTARLAGIFILSDGQIHDMPAKDTPLWRTLETLSDGAPIHAILTADVTAQDKALHILDAPSFGYVGERASITFKAVDPTKPEGQTIAILLDTDENPPRTVRVPNGAAHTVSIPITRTGANYASIQFPSATQANTTDPSLANNGAVVSISGIQDTYNVLLISGTPHMGERAWRNLLKDDPNVHLTHFTILRDPLSFDPTPHQNMALIAFPVDDLFNTHLETMDVVIMDRYASSGLLSGQHLQRIRSFVQNGGALLVVTGPETAISPDLYMGPLRDILPFQSIGSQIAGRIAPARTPAGWRHPITRSLPLRTPQGHIGGTWDGHTSVVLKPDATPLLHDAKSSAPLLAVYPAGKGRTAALMAHTFWLWGKGYDGGGPQAALTRHIFQWLTKHPSMAAERLAASVETRADGHSALHITVHTENATLPKLTITAPDGHSQVYPLRATEADSAPYFTGKGTHTVPITDHGVYKISTQQSALWVHTGTTSSREMQTVQATADILSPFIASHHGGIYTDSHTITSIRERARGTAAAGDHWVAITPRKATTGIHSTWQPIIPFWGYIAFSITLIILAWCVEAGILTRNRKNKEPT
jgi:hypothetical protein